MDTASTQETFTMVMAIRPFSHLQGLEFNNLRRFREIGMVTYERFFTEDAKRNLKEFIVIVPASDVAAVQQELTKHFPAWPWKVLSENTLLHASLPPGWARQQTVKLAVSFLVQTDLYLIVDDDTYLTKPFRGASDLRDPVSGKVLLNRTPIDFPFFFLWSCQVLNWDFDKVQDAPFHMAITPEVFITTEVKALTKHLTEKYGAQKGWQLHLANNKFTEYCLYWIWLLKQDKTKELYVGENHPMQLYGFATTGPEHNLEERVHKSFHDNAGFLFSFVQSSLPHSVSKIRDTILPYLK
jgi:hypothetical protein